MPDPFQYPSNKKKPERSRMGRVYAGPEQMARSEPDPSPIEGVYAGPEQMDPQTEQPKFRMTREEALEKRKEMQIAHLKWQILEMCRYRDVTVKPETLEDMSLEELQEMNDRIAEMPQTIYIDEFPVRPSNPLTMMVYAGPPANNPGGFFQIPGGTMQQDREPSVGECPHCHSELKRWTRFCPECGGALEMLPVCPSCGARVIEGMKFCSTCGARLKQD